MNSWNKLPLGAVINLKRGYDLPTERRNKKGDIPIISSAGISGRHDEFKAQPPGVVTGRYGTTGNVFYVTEPYWPLNTTLYVEDFKGNEPHFIYYLLQTLDFEKYSAKTSIPGVNRNELHEIIVLRPSLPEQRAIAAILSTWDEAITLTERLIAALRQRKQALMQILLTGEVRFPGFDGEWEDREFSEILNLQIGGTPSRSVPAYWDNEKTTQNRWLSIADLKSKWVRETAEYLSDLGVQHSNVKPLPAGTVVMSFKLTIGRVGILMYPSYTNEAICALIPKNNAELLNGYLYHSLSIVDFSAELDQAVKGQTLNKAKLARLHVTIPPQSEQEQIMNFLDLADQELKTVSEFLEKLRTEKRGLMQQLLTGAIRVQVEE